jgi:hypothetical protein
MVLFRHCLGHTIAIVNYDPTDSTCLASSPQERFFMMTMLSSVLMPQFVMASCPQFGAFHFFQSGTTGLPTGSLTTTRTPQTLETINFVTNPNGIEVLTKPANMSPTGFYTFSSNAFEPVATFQKGDNPDRFLNQVRELTKTPDFSKKERKQFRRTLKNTVFAFLRG